MKIYMLRHKQSKKWLGRWAWHDSQKRGRIWKQRRWAEYWEMRKGGEIVELEVTEVTDAPLRTEE